MEVNNTVKIILTVLFTLLLNNLSAQERPSFEGPIVYIEYFGNSSSAFSLSAEYLVFKTKKWYANARAGYGQLKKNDNTLRTIPIGIALFNRMGKSHFEAGLGISYSEGINTYSYGGYDGSKAFYFVPSVAYRFQMPAGGIFFRVSLNPFFKIKEVSDQDNYQYARYNKDKTYQNIGLSLGYFFSKERRKKRKDE